MYKPHCLVIYPNYLHNNPTAYQFERFLYAIKDRVDCHAVALPGPARQRIDSVSSFSVVEGYTRFWSYSGEFIKHHLPSLAIPDEMRWSANPLLLSCAHKAIQEASPFDFILTLSYPLSCHLVGAKLKLRHHIPWIAMFYDPWSDNIHRHLTDSRIIESDKRMEHKVADIADATIFTNDTMRDIWAQRYEKDDCTYSLPFCYTHDMVQHRPNNNDLDDIIVLYAGLCTEDRNLSDVIHAVGNLSKKKLLNIDRLKIWVVGPQYIPDIDLSKELGVQDYFSFWGKKPIEEMPKFYQQANCFVVVDASSQVNVHFPSKLMDYFYYQKPILGITPQKGSTTEVLKKSGHTVVENGNIRAIEEFLSSLLNGEDDSIKSFNPNWWMNYSPDRVSHQFVEIINDIIIART